MIITRIQFLYFLCFIITLVNGLSNTDDTLVKSLRDSLTLPKDHDWSGSDPCQWKGIQCDGASNRITAIQIGKSNISGTLPPDLTALTSLTKFEVMSNDLTGKIPNLSGLKSLETVYVHDNNFDSIDAVFFTGLTSLRHVSLDNNNFGSWEIPLSLKDVTSLSDFSAVNCNISGKIPDFLGGNTFPSLTSLHLSNNFLFGELPMSFVNSPLQSLLVNGQKGNDKLNGSITVLQNMTAITEVSLQGNRFSGPIPDCSGLVSLKTFNVRENQLTGNVPVSFTELQSLAVVNLTNNLLQGATPIFKGKNVLVDAKQGTNSFCLDSPGTPCDPRVDTLLSIVEAFGYPVRFAQSWKGNDPCSNSWVGITCAGSNVIVINFKNMGLTGTISPRFADLASLQVINLSENSLNGSIPQELTKLSNLKTLDVSSNQLCGNVPGFNQNVVITNGNADLGKDCAQTGPGSGSEDSGNTTRKLAEN